LAAVGDTQRELLEDVHMEVLAAMYKLAADTGVENISEKTYSMPPANLDIARILAATGCRFILLPVQMSYHKLTNRVQISGRHPGVVLGQTLSFRA
jgi:hypothetical protein